MSVPLPPSLPELTQAELRPEALAPLLDTRWLGRTYLYYPRLPSTNSEADDLAERGAPHGTVLLADEQTSGRGRQGRLWHAAAGQSLTFSAVLRPTLDPATAPALSLAAATALAGMVHELLGEPPVVKWPNDLLYHGRKLSGILLEMRAEVGRIRHVILGLGLNVNQKAWPAALEGQATSLLLARQTAGQSLDAIGKEEPWPRCEILARTLWHLETWLDLFQEKGPGPIIQRWTTYARPWLGQTIEVQQEQRVLRGQALGLTEHGALRLRVEDGEEIVLSAGEVHLIHGFAHV